MNRHHFDTALGELDDRIRDLAELAATAVTRSLEALDHSDRELAAHVVAGDELTDAAQQRMEHYAITLIATQQPVARDLRRIIEAILVGSELERIGDYAKRVAKLTASEPVPPTLRRLGSAAQTIFEHTLVALDQHDAAAAEAIGHEEMAIDRLYAECRAELIRYLEDNAVSAGRYAELIMIAHSFERIADRATNIAERIIFARSGDTVALNP